MRITFEVGECKAVTAESDEVISLTKCYLRTTIQIVSDHYHLTGPLKTSATGGCLAYHTVNRRDERLHHQSSQTIVGRPRLPAQQATENRTTGNVGRKKGGRRKGRPRKSWKDKLKELTGQSLSSLLP